MSTSPIREWTVEASGHDFIRLESQYSATSGPARAVTNMVQASDAGVVIVDDEGGEFPAPADVVLAAIFRQAEIVDDLRVVLAAAGLAIDPDVAASVLRVRLALGGALS